MNSRTPDPDRNRPATTDELLAHADWVRMLSRALLADPNEADDVAQDAWVAALKRPPTAGDGLRAWWSRVVQSAASNRRRSEERRKDREHLSAPPEDDSAGIDTATTLDAQRRLVTAIEALDEPLRRVIIGRYFHGLSSRQISELERVPDSTVRTRLQKALESLRRQLDERAGGDRSTWAMVLAPLARLDSRALPAAATAVVIASWVKLAAGIALLGVAGMAGYELLLSKRTPVEFAGSNPSVASAAEPIPLTAIVPDERKPESNSDTAVVETSTAVGEPVSLVDARILDAHGVPITEAHVQFADRSESGECSDSDAPHAESDAAGRVTLSIHDDDRQRNRGKRAGLDENTWDATFEVVCRGYATRERIATVVLGQPTALGDVVLEDGADISGRCTDGEGRPLPRARVELLHPDLSLEERAAIRNGSFWRSDRLRSAQCATDGSFRMSGIPTGCFRLYATAHSRTPAISESFQLSPGEQRSWPDLVLVESPVAIHGVVLGLDGTPCAGAEVEYTMESTKDWVGTRCRSDGTFAINGVSAAELDLCARGASEDSGEALLHGVRAGENGVVLRLPAARHFEVHVEDPAGAPVERYSLGIYHEDSTGHCGTVDAPGGLQTLQASARPFFVEVMVDGYPMIRQGPFSQGSVPARIEFRLPQSATVRGRVLRNGVPEKWVGVHLDASLDEPRLRADGTPVLAERGSSAATKEDGSFAIGAAKGGKYELWIESRLCGLAFAQHVELDLQRPIEDLVIDLAAAGAVAGHVEFTNETREHATQVMYSSGLCGSRFERIKPDGDFHIDGLTPGNWWLRVVPDTSSCDQLLPAGTEVEDPLLRRVEVRAGETTRCEFDARGSATQRVEGRVTFDHRAPTTWTATIAPQSSSWDAHRWAQPLAGDGTFCLRAPSFGTQILSLRSPGRGDRDDCIEARLGVPSDGLRWVLECDFGTLEVAGDPGAVIQVLADLSNGALWTTHAILDASGHATLDSFPAAKARVIVAGKPDSPVEVEIPAHGRTQVRLP